VAGALAVAVLGAAVARAQAPRPRLVAPVRGEAKIAYLAPSTKVSGGNVVTTIQVKNLASAPIAGLRVEEFWYDKSNNLVPGDSQTVRTPIPPGEIVTITLTTPRDERMVRNQYRFSHANGTIDADLMKTLDDE
jgi:hypothetical protein